MKTKLLIPVVAICLATLSPVFAADSVTEVFQKALFEEEANQNYDAAMRAYREVVAQMDQQRKLAATAVFRLGECYRKLGQTNEAVAQYQRILRDFPDQPTLVNLSRQNLVGLGAPAVAGGSQSGSSLSGAARNSERVRSLERQLAEAEAEYNQFRTLRAELQKLHRSALVKAIPTVLPDSILSLLLEQESKNAQLLAELSQKFSSEHPDVKTAVTVRRKIDEQIEERVDGIMAGLHLKETAAEARVSQLKKELEQAAAVEPRATPALSQTARLEQKRLLEKEIKLVEEQLKIVEDLFPKNKSERTDIIAKERELLALRRQLAALDVGPTTASPAGAAESGATDEEDKEIRRIQAMIKNSPDLINAPGPDKLTPLDSAARKGQLVVARFLLDNKADPNFRPRYGSVQFPLSAAAANGHKSMVELLVARGADVNADDGGALRIAAEKGFQSVVEALLAAKANPNLSDSRGETALHRAVENRLPAIAELLIKNGADVNAVNRVGKPSDDPGRVAVRQADGTPLHIAASQGDVAMVSLLLSNRADVNLVNFLGETPLHVSASQLPIVTNLLAAGADVNRAVADGPFKGWTPLLYAVSWNGTNAAKALLQAGADPNVYAATILAPPEEQRPNYAKKGGRVGYTPLLMAVTKVQPEMVNLLVENKADANKETPLTVAVASGDVASAKALLEHGANVESKFDDGDTPLLRATQRADEDMVALLLKHKADPNVRTAASYRGDGGPGWTPLLIAAKEGYKGIAELLLTHGADPNLKENSGTSPLWRAVSWGDKPLAELLLTNGVSVDTRFWEENTCLARAISQSDIAMATLLLDHHADPNATNKYGQTPLHLIVRKSKEQENAVPGMLAPPRGIRPATPGMPTGLISANSGHPPAPPPADLIELAKLLLDRKADPNLRDNSGMTPLNLFGVPANPRDDTQKALVALLRERGAKDALPDLAPDPNVIRIWRQGMAKGDVVFTKDSNGLNRFTVMDVVVSFYGAKQQEWFQQKVDNPSGLAGTLPLPALAYVTWWHRGYNGSPMKGYLAFPDLGALKIHRPTRGGTNEQILADLLISGTREARAAGASLDCRRDVELQFGDVVEVPERDHPLSDPTVGLTESEHSGLVGCLQRNAKLIFKGATNALEIAPAESRYLSLALNSPQALTILSTSADLSRVKVTRFNPTTRAVETNFTTDVQQFRNDRRPISEDLALRDGDEIEVPDK